MFLRQSSFVFFRKKTRNDEKQRLMFATKVLRKQDQILCEVGLPVAFFVWKLIDYTTITVTKDPQFLQEVQENVESSIKIKMQSQKIREFIQNPQLAQVKPKKQEIVKFTGNESELMKSFFTRPAAAIC